MLRATLAVASILLAGCASAPDTRERLPAGRSVDVHHVSRLGPAVANQPVHAQVPASDSEPPASEEFVRLRCTQYRVDAGSLASLVEPNGARAFARVASRDDVRRVLEARIADGSVQRSSRPSILVRDGGKAWMSQTQQQAFVEAFEITRVGTDLVGDPCVAVAEEGVVLEVSARLGPSPSIGVEVTLNRTELLRTILESNVRVPGSLVDVVLQLPLAFRQELASSASLGPDEVLVLGGLLDRDGAYDLLVVVDAQRQDGGGAGHADRAAP